MKKAVTLLLVILNLFMFSCCSDKNYVEIIKKETSLDFLLKETIESNVDGTSSLEDTETEFSETTEYTPFVTTQEQDINPLSDTAQIEITVISYPKKIKNGETATLVVKGLPNTEYSIKVYYSSGASKAAGLENKISDSDGKITWKWKIGSRTKDGEHKIEISGENGSTVLYFTTYK